MNALSPQIKATTLALLVLAGILAAYSSPEIPAPSNYVTAYPAGADTLWQPPKVEDLPKNAEGGLILYGRELVAHTANYLGPKGSVKQNTNGMNCQNCHLEAGTKIMGNNYAAVFSTYPKYRTRSGSVESVVKRISDCFERSLNGVAPDSSSREMQAMIAYMKWLGHDVPKGVTPKGTGLEKLAFLDRAADPEKGRLIYQAKCQVCHGANGEGLPAPDGMAYVYPPLWGEHSYNDGAGLFRIASFAGYVKNNMPLGATYQNPQLTDEEAWDLAAFVNSRPHPHREQSGDWMDNSQKPIDAPYGPYADGFSEQQHKFGPFQPIAEARKK
ncbi:c-type cytochrome [Persicitalea sp.]|uniref:c-type cytochrome n=1 Tax=Persicitalea sp. TaxID=3100273 RepID=UPI003593DCC0